MFQQLAIRCRHVHYLWSAPLLCHLDLKGKEPCHCCLAPCKSVTNYGPLTEPKFYIVKSALTQIPTSNGHISETKRRILYPLVPKIFSRRGLSPTHESGLASHFHHFVITFHHFFGVFQVKVAECHWSEFAPGPIFKVRRKKITWRPILWHAV